MFSENAFWKIRFRTFLYIIVLNNVTDKSTIDFFLLKKVVFLFKKHFNLTFSKKN